MLVRSPSMAELRPAAPAHASPPRRSLCRSRSQPAPARAGVHTSTGGVIQRLPPASALPAWLSRFAPSSAPAEPAAPVVAAVAPEAVAAAPVPIALAQTDEAAGALKRTQESAAAGVAPVSLQRPPRGGDPLPPGPGWAWSLNWDPVLLRSDGSAEVFVGSCPRCAADVDRLVDEAGVEAILCLQSADCWKAMGIDGEAVERRAGERGVLWLRVAVRDFDRLDQAAMLPDIVRALSALTAARRRTYVHCTAGINRAPLSVVGLLTFVRGWEVDAAVAHIKGERGQANPYVEPWRLARQRLLAGREEELYLLSQAEGAGCSKLEGGDWVARDWGSAQRRLLMSTFARRAEVDINMFRSARVAAPPAPLPAVSEAPLV